VKGQATLLTAAGLLASPIPLALVSLGATALIALLLRCRTLRLDAEARSRDFRAAADRLAFYGLVQAQVSDALIALDANRRVTMWNPAAEALLGVPACRALGTEAAGLLRSRVSAIDVDAVRAEIAGSGRWRGESRMRHADGREVHIEATVQVLRRADGTPDGHLIVLHDIDRWRRAEDERERAEQERRKLELHMQQVQRLESLGVLAGGIAHDFNNLLVGILGHAGLALGDLPEDAPARRHIEQIETCSLRAGELTTQLLAYAGKARFTVQPTDLSAVVGEMANLLHTAISKSARLDLRLEPGLPATLADRAQLRQVVMNLITNASDALADRQGTILVTTGRTTVTRTLLDDACIASAADPGEYVYLEVQDSGCGIDAETRARMFEPFFTTKASGRGLGLAAVLGIVRGHRGAVHLDSAPGQGTTFRVLLPVCAAAAANEAAPRPVAAPERRPAARVLVVDDEPAVRVIAREALVRAGFDVVVAGDGEAALEVFRKDGRAIHAVLLDMTMPGLSGLETLRGIHELVRGVPVVLTSGYSEEDAAQRVNGEVIAGFIQKPFAPSALVAKMTEVLSESAA
jgi:PAS domain S-box-containing protein